MPTDRTPIRTAGFNTTTNGDDVLVDKRIEARLLLEHIGAGTTRSIKARWVRSVGSPMAEREPARSLEPLTVHSDRSASTGSSNDARLAAGTAAKNAVNSRQPIGITMLNASVGYTSCSNPFTKPDR